MKLSEIFNLKMGLTLSVVLFFASGCTQYQPNPRIEKIEDYYSVMQDALSGDKRSDELFFVMTFSGGGTRAAAMSYGILEALNRVKVPGNSKSISGHTLLDEVDIISSVSGGSFTAAYYGLHGKKAFEDYPERFLYRNVQSELLWRLFNPFRWPKLMSSGYNRSEMAADYYDEILFDGKLMGDMFDRIEPAVLIQATDITEGYIFSFTPYFFSMICASLDDIRVSRAVTASSSYPGAFSGISLTNYRGECGYESEPWVYEVVRKNETLDMKYRFAKRELHYSRKGANNYIHLYDGGVNDNLGLRGPFISLLQLAERGVDPEKVGLSNTKQVVFIIVNAQTNKSKDKKILNLIPRPPSPTETLSASLDTVMNSSNFFTLYIFHNYMESKSFQKMLSDGPIDRIKYSVIHINFENIEDEEERAFFESVPTSLNLPPETVDRLRDKAGELLYGSEQFQEMISELGGRIPQAD
jgi:NTE family protein